jgi:uncharacterized protein
VSIVALELLWNRAAVCNAPTLLLAHGAGAPMDSDFMQAIAEGLAAHGVTVARFEFDYMAQRRVDQRKRPPQRQDKLLTRFAQAAEQAGGLSNIFIGGKSMGGRMATYLAAGLHGSPDQSTQGHSRKGICRGVVALGYPLHPPHKPEQLRMSHFGDLGASLLICQGERDAFGARAEVEALQADGALVEEIEWRWLPDGDHDFKPRVRSGFLWQDNIDTAVAHIAQWILARSA